MNELSVAFKIVSERHCPYYTTDDLFVLTNQTVQFPFGYPSCLILVREVTNLLFNSIVQAVGTEFEELKDKIYSCGGCTGLIKFQVECDSKKVEEEMASFPLEEDEGGEGETVSAREREKLDGVVVSGQLSEISPSELMQFFHMHQKTGKLILDVPSGTGRVTFREGSVVGAKFLEYEDKDAFFALLREKHGRFSFVNGTPDSLLDENDIGDFMMILLEGIKLMDENEG